MHDKLRLTENKALLAWYDRVHRKLPWRMTNDPYAIWVSEIMLQQTQVATVLPYYQRWMERFPTIESLAEANLDEVFQYWQGLGYYRRARHLHEGAQHVAELGWPTSYAEWLSIPGVGAYTAAALSSLCLGLPTGVVDGNVERVFSRFTANASTGSALKRAAQVWADHQIDPENPATWNQAIMELGATVCVPRTPKCGECPWSEYCVARQTWQVERFPVKKAKRAAVATTWSVAIPWNGSAIGLTRAAQEGWWPDMWEFPHKPAEEWPAGPPTEGHDWAESVGSVPHSVTHHKLKLDVWVLRTQQAREWTWVSLQEVDSYAMPSAMRKCLQLARKSF